MDLVLIDQSDPPLPDLDLRNGKVLNLLTRG